MAHRRRRALTRNRIDDLINTLAAEDRMTDLEHELDQVTFDRTEKAPAAAPASESQRAMETKQDAAMYMGCGK